MSIITLTTDFGVGSPYVAAMKGVILSINPAATIVDSRTPFRRERYRPRRAWLWKQDALVSIDTIHVAVVDPGVGTERSILYARIGKQQYIAPDNGLLSRLTARTWPSMILRLTERDYWLPEVSNTFHGRDIMAPAAAHLSLGVHPRRLGPIAGQLNRFDSPRPKVAHAKIVGEVMSIDSFGNLITNVLDSTLTGQPHDKRVCIVCGLYETFGIYNTYGEQPPGTLLRTVGSAGRLELAIVGDNAAARLGVAVGRAGGGGVGVTKSEKCDKSQIFLSSMFLSILPVACLVTSISGMYD